VRRAADEQVPEAAGDIGVLSQNVYWSFHVCGLARERNQEAGWLFDLGGGGPLEESSGSNGLSLIA
jgi:hypothetical protein